MNKLEFETEAKRVITNVWYDETGKPDRTIANALAAISTAAELWVEADRLATLRAVQRTWVNLEPTYANPTDYERMQTLRKWLDKQIDQLKETSKGEDHE